VIFLMSTWSAQILLVRCWNLKWQTWDFDIIKMKLPPFQWLGSFWCFIRTGDELTYLVSHFLSEVRGENCLWIASWATLIMKPSEQSWFLRESGHSYGNLGCSNWPKADYSNRCVSVLMNAEDINHVFSLSYRFRSFKESVIVSANSFDLEFNWPLENFHLVQYCFWGR